MKVITLQQIEKVWVDRVRCLIKKTIAQSVWVEADGGTKVSTDIIGDFPGLISLLRTKHYLSDFDATVTRVREREPATLSYCLHIHFECELHSNASVISFFEDLSQIYLSN